VVKSFTIEGKIMINFKIFSDYICPFCYIGKGIVDQLKKEYAINDKWVSYELHPETPPAGMLLSERFKGYDLSSFYDQLRARGKEVGVDFGTHTLLSNSRLALMASEYARDLDRYDSFHENIFHAYFTEGLDIGRLDVIASVAKKSGLDEKATINAVNDGRYASRLNEARKEGQLIGLTGVPLFVIENKYKIVGAQPIETFRDLFEKN
jgi:predicted DsbA family dithiol-disulfide isomerase